MKQTVQDKLRVLARHLGCNEEALVREGMLLIETERKDAVRDFVNEFVPEKTLELEKTIFDGRKSLYRTIQGWGEDFLSQQSTEEKESGDE